MRLVLDANEYIFALGAVREPACAILLETLRVRGGSVRIERTIVQEVTRHLHQDDLRAFFAVLGILLEEGSGIDEDFIVPHHVAQHYQDIGFKEGDAHIAAYAHVVEADVLVSENRRHFHARATDLPFKVMDAAQFLKRHAAAR